jgi:hypothetical protein
MKVDLFSNNKFELVWPMTASEEERITLFCEKISHGDKRKIEDSLIQVDSGGFGKRKGGKVAQNLDELKIKWGFGAAKDMKINASVKGWDNVLDKSGGMITFSLAKLQDLIDINCGVSIAEHGNLEDELIDLIDIKNGLKSEPDDSGNLESGS